jgi:cytochrome c oxidase assembly factor CtaG
VTHPLRPLVAAGAIALALALTVFTGGSFSARTGYEDAAREVLLRDWWTLWAVPPVEVALIALIGAALLLSPASREGARRAYAISGLAVLLLAVCSPLAGLAQGGLFAAHMLQHVLIGAVAPLLVLLALPRAVPGATPRRWWARLLHPGIAFALWVTSTIVWLAPGVHHHVLDDQAIWILQQVSFFAFGIVLWAPVTERLTPAPSWFGSAAKCGYMLGVWVVGVITANIYWFSGTAFYSSHTAAAEAWGIGPLQDQANAGTVMLLTHCAIAFTAIAVLFARQAREQQLEQRLVEAGLEPGLVRDAIRYGGSERLAAQVGVPLRSREGID